MLAVLEKVGVRRVAREHGCSPQRARKWWQCWRQEGVAGRIDAPQSGRLTLYDDTTHQDLLALATAQAPAPFAAWNRERLSQAAGELNCGVSPS